MNYIKKLCIVKQVAPGFAADGKSLSALLTAEQFAGKLTLTVALIGFAPLTAGRYRCVVCDAHGGAEIFDLNGSSGCSVRRASALNIADGLACAVCFVHKKATPAAFGTCGEHTYDLSRMCALLDAQEAPQDTQAPTDAQDAPYDDELVASENYYAYAQEEHTHATTQGTAAERGKNAGKDAHDQSLFRFAGAESLGADARPCYYDTVKAELDALFATRPAEQSLQAGIPCSRWVRVEFGKGKYYVVGVIEEKKRAKYICYGVPASERGAPPDALKAYSSFVPVSLFAPDGAGYWMMFQDAETGQCVKLAQS